MTSLIYLDMISPFVALNEEPLYGKYFYEVPSWHSNYVFDRSLLVMALILLSGQATGGTNMYFTVKFDDLHLL